MIEGKLSCNMIYQDDDCIAILDKYPIDNGHSLVITKKPYEKLKSDLEKVSNQIIEKEREININVKQGEKSGANNPAECYSCED